MKMEDSDQLFDATTSELVNEGVSTLIANVSTGQLNGHNQIEIQVRNMTVSCHIPFHVDLRTVALNSKDVSYDRNRNILYKQQRNPFCYIKVYNSGAITIVGCHSEEECRRAARGIGRTLQRCMNKLNITTRLKKFRISNMMATCKLPFGVKIEEMARKYPRANYEPELSVGLTWKFDEIKATLRIHTTGSITIMGTTSSNDAILAIQKIFPIAEEFRCDIRYGDNKSGIKRRIPQLPTAYEISKKARKTAPTYDPALSGFFEAEMQFEDDEENYYETNSC